MTGLLSKFCLVNQSKTIIHIYLNNYTYEVCKRNEIFSEQNLLTDFVSPFTGQIH